MSINFQVPFANEHIEAACIDLQVQQWRKELNLIPDGEELDRRNKLIGMIFEGQRKAAQLRVSYSQKSQRY